MIARPRKEDFYDDLKYLWTEIGTDRGFESVLDFLHNEFGDTYGDIYVPVPSVEPVVDVDPFDQEDVNDNARMARMGVSNEDMESDWEETPVVEQVDRERVVEEHRIRQQMSQDERDIMNEEHRTEQQRLRRLRIQRQDERERLTTSNVPTGIWNTSGWGL